MNNAGLAKPVALALEPLVALELLTILSLGRARIVGADLLARSQGYFPAVGLLLGAALYGLHEALPSATSPLLAGWLLVGALALLTRGFHLDGLADTLDGLGGHTPEDRLRIMRDSAIGSFGAVGLVIVLGAKAAAIGSLASGQVLPALLLAPALARWAAVSAMAVFPYARPAGLGRGFHAASRYRPLTTAGLTAVIATALLGGAEGLALLAGVTLGSLGFGLLISRALAGGLTGDSYGAIVEIAETAALSAFAAGVCG